MASHCSALYRLFRYILPCLTVPSPERDISELLRGLAVVTIVVQFLDFFFKYTYYSPRSPIYHLLVCIQQ